MQPFYDPLKTYQQNFEQGPFGALAESQPLERSGQPAELFLDFPLYLPFGIPAGPLVNSNFTAAAFRQGFDICVYKTVRSHAKPCHPWPNVLPIEIEDKLAANSKKPVETKAKYESPLSITNSFGVPSPEPDWWQEDMAQAVKSAGKGQVMIASFQGSGPGRAAVVADYAATAKLVAETGAKIMIANLSCPNEGKAELLCFDVPTVKEIAFEIKQKIGNISLLLKLAYFPSDQGLEKIVTQLGPIVQGFTAINTIPSKVVDASGKQALPGEGRDISGICGASIKWAGLEMTQRLKNLRQKHDLDFVIVGVGGVTQASDYNHYRQAGADAVMSATGAMWNPNLAREIYQQVTNN